jgi:pimeloyl-ACP methyl ester carboxylesterase
VLLVNPGGPGDSGVDFAVRRATSHFSAATQANFDIVGFDSRGIGGSQPVKCLRSCWPNGRRSTPATRRSSVQLAEYNRTLREDCLAAALSVRASRPTPRRMERPGFGKRPGQTQSGASGMTGGCAEGKDSR